MKKTITSLKKLLFSSLLLLIALSLFTVLMIPAFIISLISVFINKKLHEGIYRLGEIIYSGAISIDQFANTAFQEFWNITLKKKEGYKFGNPDETISGVLGKNKQNKTLSKVGIILDKILDFLDNNHSINSIEIDE